MVLVNIALYCSKAEIRVPVVVGGGCGVVQTNFRVKPTTKLLWIAFGLGCCCLAWLWGYDNLPKKSRQSYPENEDDHTQKLKMTSQKKTLLKHS